MYVAALVERACPNPCLYLNLNASSSKLPTVTSSLSHHPPEANIVASNPPSIARTHHVKATLGIPPIHDHTCTGRLVLQQPPLVFAGFLDRPGSAGEIFEDAFKNRDAAAIANEVEKIYR